MQEPRKCEQCGVLAEFWTIAKGFVLLCDRCLLRANTSRPSK